MANVIINDVNLTNIANAIRGKNGSSDTYKPSEMADAITNLSTGGGGVEVEPIVIENSADYIFSGAISSAYVKLFGNTISTKDITTMANMFHSYSNESIPFQINAYPNSSIPMESMFNKCTKLKTLPDLRGNFKPQNMNHMFYNCMNLREIPEDYFDYVDFSKVLTNTNAYSNTAQNMFYSCRSLRKIPDIILNTANPSIRYSYTIFYQGFNSCNALDEIVGLTPNYTATWTSNAFSTTFNYCYRIKDLIFSKNSDGLPYTVNWKKQTIDLSTQTGYGASYSRDIEPYNSGITADKEVKDDATYEALKNDPDWFSTLVAYSRYNRTSAVNTINSLPDTSAYLASSGGGTNTIKFTGEAGSATDGGAINTMTEEEIAIATAKGWTVSFV